MNKKYLMNSKRNNIRTQHIFLFIKTYLNVALVAYFVLSGYGILGAVMGLLITDLIVFLIMASLIISDWYKNP